MWWLTPFHTTHIKTMTPEQQRIAIAEACGWKVHPKDRFIVIPPNSPNSVQPLHTLPDYLNDLNACSGLVDHMQTLGFNCVLIAEGEYRCCTFISNDRSREIKVISSSFTKSICEAFLKALNLWNDEA
jgi:hypothetical protein